MTQSIVVSKSGIDAGTATDPNDFIFHSDYNTLKIVANGTFDFSVGTSATIVGSVAHGLSYTPMVNGFMREDSGTFVSGPNQQMRLTSVGYADLIYHDISADGTNVYFRVQNTDTIAAGTAHFTWFAFEIPF